MLNRGDNRHFYRMMVNADVKLMINDPEAARVIDGVCREVRITECQRGTARCHSEGYAL